MTSWESVIGVELEDAAFRVHHEHLEIGGMPAAELLAAHGATAAYVYDGASLKRRMQRLRRALDSRVRLKYAVKANPHPDLLRFLEDLVDGFDVASTQEMNAVLGLEIDAATLSLAGPGKSRNLLEQAVSGGVVISIEAEREISELTALARTTGRRPKVLLRVNPAFGLRASGMRMSGLSSPFGIDAESAAGVLARFPEELDYLGLHIFCGSQCLSEEALIDAHRRVFDLAMELTAECRRPLRSLNIGAGFGIPYHTGERPLHLERVASAFDAHVRRLLKNHAETVVELELGRYAVGESGVYLCTVVDKKYSRGEVFLITSGGMHHHLAASGNLGQVIKRNYPICVANRVTGSSLERVNITGVLCTPLDVLARGVVLPKAEPGDTIAIFQSGAYGFSASPTKFLGHPPAPEIFLPP